LGSVSLPIFELSGAWLTYTWGRYLDECESARDAAYDYDGNDHEAHFSHELVAGAAAFAGMKAFEDHQRNEGMVNLPMDLRYETLWQYC
jgi:hypothetical protein